MSKKVLTAAFAACLFVLILTAKWATFDRYGSPMPDWDQWDAEALETYVPWFTDDHFLTHLFTPHNEHRVVLTKLQNLGLVLLNGQWDSRLEAVTNAALHALLGAAFWVFGTRILPTSRLAPLASSLLFALAFALFGLPVAWQNVLGGFHSQQYWLAGLSFAAIVTLPFVRSWSPAWWIGAVSAILVLGSMGSGFLAAATVLVVLGFRLLRRESSLRAAWPALALSLALVAVGILTRHEVPWHAEMKAKTVHDFVFTIVHSLQWPWRDRHWAALVLWLPWLLLATQVLSAKPAPGTQSPEPKTQNPKLQTPNSKLQTNSIPQAVLALGGWVLLQLAATAYARGAGADYPASRYMDTLTFGAMANALALAWLLTTPRTATVSRFSTFPLFRFSLSLLWLATLGFGLYNLLAHTVRWELIDAKKYYVKAEGHMRRYLATNDPRHFEHKDIPFPSAEGLVERLAIPSLRALMPVPIRTPLALSPVSDASESFRPNTATAIDIDPANPPRVGLSPATPPLDYTTSWGSFGANAVGAAAQGTWKSAPLSAPLGGWLKFETAGDLAPAPDETLSLALHDAATGAHLADVRPNRTPGDTWRSAYVRAPAVPFVIVATDRTATGWLAFSPPVEMAWFSVLAWQAAKHAALVFWITLGVTALLATLALFRPSRPPAPAAVA